MNTYICNKLPNNLEFGAVVLADDKETAKRKIKELVESEGWLVHLNEINVEILNDVAIIDPLNNY